jgi:predicted phosphodiesterase
MKIGYTSDLHLEFLDFPDFSNDPGGDVLILAGDILTAFSLAPWRTDKGAIKLRKYLADHFKPQLLDKYSAIYMVLGNHEHYHCIYQKTDEYLRRYLADNNLHNITLLNNTCVTVGDYKLVGATLWTDFERGNPISMANVAQGMNDYRIIWNNEIGKPLTPAVTYNDHQISRDYIAQCAAQFADNKILVVTHHGPTNQSLHREHVGNGIDGGYCSDLSNLILDNPNITHWISGHTHIISQYNVGDTQVLANCRGYRGESSYRQWNGVSHFEV